MRHPRDMGATEVEAFLTMLVTRRRVSASTHKQALCAILFLYRQVLGMDLPWMQDLRRPTTPKRIPAVLTPAEVRQVLDRMAPPVDVMARLLYGTGMRLMEGLRLRVNDVTIQPRLPSPQPSPAVGERARHARQNGGTLSG